MKTRLFIALLIALFLWNCTNEEPVMSTVQSTETSEMSSGRYLSAKEACELAVKAFKDFQMEPSSRSTRTAFATLYRPAASRAIEDTIFYVVNFTEGGFAVVVADRNVEVPIIAISDKGLFSEEMGNESFKEYMNYAAISFPPIYWRDTVYSQVDSIDLQIDTVTTYNDRFLPTLWGQWWPYNKYCPTFNNQHAPTGCAAVAMGQIFAFHRRPQYINGYYLDWNAMLLAQKIDFLADDLIGENCIAHLLRECGILLDTSYGIEGSSTKPSHINGVYRTLGFKNVTTDNELNGCINSLINYGPVQMIGYLGKDGERGHTWVVDALKILTFKYSNLRSKKEYYLHMNWGSEGTNDGYYLIKDGNLSVNNILGYSDFSYITNIN